MLEYIHIQYLQFRLQQQEQQLNFHRQKQRYSSQGNRLAHTGGSSPGPGIKFPLHHNSAAGSNPRQFVKTPSPGLGILQVHVIYYSLF